MIINIRGTSGSGKSTIVRTVMDLYATQRPVTPPGSKRPVLIQLWHRSITGSPDLTVIGRYDTSCGGVDLLRDSTAVYDMAIEAHGLFGCHVVYEGLVMSEDTKRTVSLARDVGAENLLVIVLTTPLEECLAMVNARRMKRDPKAGLVNPRQTAKKLYYVNTSAQKLIAQGINTEFLDRDQALTRVKELLLL